MRINRGIILSANEELFRRFLILPKLPCARLTDPDEERLDVAWCGPRPTVLDVVEVP